MDRLEECFIFWACSSY